MSVGGGTFSGGTDGTYYVIGVVGSSESSESDLRHDPVPWENKQIPHVRGIHN